MQTLNLSPDKIPISSSVLVVGPTHLNLSLGVDWALDSTLALELIERGGHFVFVLQLPLSHPGKYNLLFKKLRKNRKLFEVIIWGENPQPDLIDGLKVFRFLHADNSDPESEILQALEKVQLLKQNSQLVELIQQQDQKLRALAKDIEERVSKRQAYLQSARAAVTETSLRTEAFQRALIAIHRATHTREMETLLHGALGETIGISWIRITVGSTEIIQRQTSSEKLHTCKLRSAGENLGSVIFGRKETAFDRKEKEFLTQIADSVSLAMWRLKILRETEEIQMQWEATFNSITSPLALIDENFHVHRANGSFLKNQVNLENQKCFEILHRRKEPCPGCSLGQRFQIDLSPNVGKVKIFDVSSQKISNQKIFVNIYRDISSQLQIEARIMESAKVAELGTIGSSIAHELNNPLGGILTFLHLIKMDLKGDEAFYSDIIALEDASKKCRDIISNLLSFSRTDSETQERLDLQSVVRRAIQIIELHTRSTEIQFVVQLDSDPFFVWGNFGNLSQAFMTYLQMAVDSTVRLKDRPANIHISGQVTQNQMTLRISFLRNSDVWQGPEILRRTIAERILADVNAHAEYSSEMQGQFEVKISFDTRKLSPEV